VWWFGTLAAALAGDHAANTGMAAPAANNSANAIPA